MKKKFAIVLSAIMAIGIVNSTSLQPANVVNADSAVTTVAEDTARFTSPVYDAETDTTNWDYAYFGMYPKTEVTGNALTTDIINADYNEDVSQFEVAEVDGVKYVRMIQGNATANATPSGGLRGLTYTEEAFYKWSDNKTYHYFRYEPVKWRVLESSGDSVLLMADNAIDCRQYSTNTEKYSWSDSPMRVWLNGLSDRAANGYTCGNGGFLYTAFSEEERSDILTSTVHTEDNNLWGESIPGGKDVNDKVFLLSISEAMNSDYGFAPDAMTLSSTRRLEPTDYAFAMGTWLGTYGKYYGNCWWMLRTSGDYREKMALIYNTGQVYKEGYYVNTPYYGVVPAMRVKVDSQYLMTQEEYDEKYPDIPDINVKYGDVDGNGKVDLKDATYALSYAVGISSFRLEDVYVGTEDVANIDLDKVIDVNGDKKVNLEDATLILKCSVGIIDIFPIEENGNSSKAVQALKFKAAEESKDNTEIKTYEKHKASGKVWIAADSIAAQHDNTTSLAASSLTVKTRDTLGWGVIFNNYFNDANYCRYEDGKLINTKFADNTTDSAVVINNTALSSRSAKSFTSEKNYNVIKDEIGQGDYLLISFGHNDEYPQVERYTNPYADSNIEGSYKWYLKTNYIDPALEAGATPVLISSVVKRNYIDGVYQPQFHEAYATAMKELSEEYAAAGVTVPYIDLHHKMDDLYKTLSDDESKLLHASYDVAEFNEGGQSKIIDILLGDTADDQSVLARETLAKEKLATLTVDEVQDVVSQAAAEVNSQGVSYINSETSGSHMDNVHFTYAGAQYAAKYILEGLKGAQLDLYDLTNEDAVKTLDDIQTPQVFKESELYKNFN